MSGVVCLTYRAVDLAFRGLDPFGWSSSGFAFARRKEKPPIRIGSDTAQSGVACSTWFLGESSGGLGTLTEAFWRMFSNQCKRQEERRQPRFYIRSRSRPSRRVFAIIRHGNALASAMSSTYQQSDRNQAAAPGLRKPLGDGLRKMVQGAKNMFLARGRVNSTEDHWPMLAFHGSAKQDLPASTESTLFH
jgi:hypothetical protein